MELDLYLVNFEDWEFNYEDGLENGKYVRLEHLVTWEFTVT